jgi:hypothetical protein
MTPPRFCPGDRAFPASPVHRLPRDVLSRSGFLVRPQTLLGWHRDLLMRRHAARSRHRRPRRPRVVRSICLLVLRLARENPWRGYRHIHGELLVLGVRIAASTVREILHDAGINPGARAHLCHLGRLLPLPGRCHACLRLLRDRHLERRPPETWPSVAVDPGASRRESTVAVTRASTPRDAGFAAPAKRAAAPEPPGYDRGTRIRKPRVALRWRGSWARTDTTHCPISRYQLQR